MLHDIGGYFRVSKASWSPDDGLVAAGEDGDRVMVWDAATGAVVHVLRTDDNLAPSDVNKRCTVICVAWSPDGSMLTCGSIGAPL